MILSKNDLLLLRRGVRNPHWQSSVPQSLLLVVRMSYLHGKIAELTRQFREGSLSVLEVCESAILQQKKTSSLNAIVTPLAQVALEGASQSQHRYEKGTPLGPLDGVPVAVKDNFCTRGIRTTCGSKMLHNYIPPYNATVVQRLQDAGAILVGKTNLDEFAMGSGTVDSIFKPTRNLHRSGISYSYQQNGNQYESVPTHGLENDWYIAGGSSGGSAAAVSSGIAFSAIGSDTGGSVRNPASYCGVVGLKPSYGVVPRTGLVSLVNTMDAPGIFGRHVDDVAIMLGTIAGIDRKDSTSISSDIKGTKSLKDVDIKTLTVGIPKEYFCPFMEPEVVEVWTNVADIFENAGAKVVQVSMPHTQYSIHCYSILNPCEVASNFTRYTGLEYGHRVNSTHSMEAVYALTRSQGLSETVRGRILAGNYFLLRENIEKYFKHALKVRRLVTQDFNNVWNHGIDVLLTPVTLSAAPRYSDFRKKDNRTQSAEQDFCTQPANLAGVCAASLPVQLNDEGLPLSLQLTAPHCKDVFLLSVAKWLEEQVSFPRLQID